MRYSCGGTARFGITRRLTNKGNSVSLETVCTYLLCTPCTCLYAVVSRISLESAFFRDHSIVSLTGFIRDNCISHVCRLPLLGELYPLVLSFRSQFDDNHTGAIQEKRAARGRRVGSRTGGAPTAWSNWPTCARCSPLSVASLAVFVTVSEWPSHCVLHAETGPTLTFQTPTESFSLDTLGANGFLHRSTLRRRWQHGRERDDSRSKEIGDQETRDLRRGRLHF